jgi:hypothetical protein
MVMQNLCMGVFILLFSVVIPPFLAQFLEFKKQFFDEILSSMCVGECSNAYILNFVLSLLQFAALYPFKVERH